MKKINFIKGNIKHQQDDINKSIELFNLIIEKVEFNEQALTNKGICLLEQNHLNEAEKCFDTALQKIKII